MMAALRRLPVVVVLGATGTGKSKLAIELGQRFNGEIISADSMQLYKGLDVITNKVTEEEQAACPHHLLSVLDPLACNNTVTHFRDMALPLMERLLADNKVPIIVGGTNYYIEALLWNFLIDKETADLAKAISEKDSPAPSSSCQNHSNAESAPETSPSPSHTTPENKGSHCNEGHAPTSPSPSLLPSPHTAAEAKDSSCTLSSQDGSSSSSSEVDEKEPSGSDEQLSPTSSSNSSCSAARQEKEGKYATWDSDHLHSLLQKVDPATAQRLHPKNRRKVIRALQVYDDYGVPMSHIHQAQHSKASTPGLSGALRYPHCCVFWIQSQQEVLDERLDGRVENMLSNGLMTELHTLHSQYLQNVATRNGEPDYTLGIFQSIGFKEFHQYLILPVEERETPKGQELFQKGVEALKLATRQYARRQLKWIKNRFLKRAGPHVPAVYGVDSTDPSQWTSQVLGPATSILSALIQGRDSPVPPMCPDSVPGTVHVHNVCDVCEGRVFTTLQEWQAHLGSRKHKKMLQRQRHREKAEHQKQQQHQHPADRG